MLQLSTSVQPISSYFDAHEWEKKWGCYLEKLPKKDKYNLIILIGAKGDAQCMFPEKEKFGDFNYPSESAQEEHCVFFEKDELELCFLADKLSESESLKLLNFLAIDLLTTEYVEYKSH